MNAATTEAERKAIAVDFYWPVITNNFTIDEIGDAIDIEAFVIVSIISCRHTKKSDAATSG